MVPQTLFSRVVQGGQFKLTSALCTVGGGGGAAAAGAGYGAATAGAGDGAAAASAERGRTSQCLMQCRGRQGRQMEKEEHKAQQKGGNQQRSARP